MKLSGIVLSLFSLRIASSLQAAEASLEQIKSSAAKQSKYLSTKSLPAPSDAPEADRDGFRSKIEPILAAACVQCHGPEKQKGKFRIDTLDPDLIHGEDADWWLEVIDVLSNGEMPPPDEDVELKDADRAKVIDWLSEQVGVASQVERSEGGHSSFRRMTRYEFNYALQDLLGMTMDFAKDLPPETVSEDGFRNSSEMLQMTSLQFATYRDIARKALNYATVRGPRPEPVSFSITMDKGGPLYEQWVHTNISKLERQMEIGLEPDVNVQLHEDILKSFTDAREQMERTSASRDGERSGRSRRGANFLNRKTEESWSRRFPYGWSLWQPHDGKPVDPEVQDFVTELPHGVVIRSISETTCRIVGS